jgi:lipopolysaccharide export system permease protein
MRLLGKGCTRCSCSLSLRLMRLLDRYLFRELITPLMFCLGGFLIFWISFDLFNELNELQDRKLHLLDVLEYSVAMIPQVLVTLLPVILLLALLHALTQHARHNEITAMRAAGISLWRICAPHFIVGAFTGLALFATSEFLVPRSADWANHILSRHVQKTGDLSTQEIYQNLGFKNPRADRFWHIGEYHVSTGEMIRPQVIWTLPDGSIRHLTAGCAVFTNRVWTFYGVIEYNQTNRSAPIVPLLLTNELAKPEFEETPRLFRNEIKIANYKTLGVSTEDLPLSDIVSYLKLHPRLSRGDSGWLLTQLNERVAAPFTCLVVVLIAIPFGAASGRRNLFVGVAGSIFICFGFIVAQKVGLALGTSGRVPAWLAAWLPNLIFAGTGLALTLRTR